MKIDMKNFERILMLIALLFGVFCVLTDGASAADLYLDSVNGSDSNTGTSWQDAVATWPRMVGLGAANESTGVYWALNDTPTVEVARLIISGKDDRENITRYRVLIEGHQSVNIQDKEQSETARCKIITDCIWELYDTPQGKQERMIGKGEPYVVAY